MGNPVDNLGGKRRRRVDSAAGAAMEAMESRRLLSATLYVDAASPAGGAGNGSSWAQAFTDLQAALGAASSGTTIEVAQGTYKPTSGTDRTATFQLIDGVNLEGGFAGNSAVNPDARDIAGNPTILSGDIGAAGDNSDNSYHVVTADETDATAVLDGFTVSGGNADGSAGSDGIGDDGGGLLIDAGDPTINNCTFANNVAAGIGGGVSVQDVNTGVPSPVFNYCIFTHNNASTGGGLDYEGGYGNLTQSQSTAVVGCRFIENTATQSGGGLANSGNPLNCANCLFAGNSAMNGGALAASGLTLTNCTATGNSASGLGGGLYLDVENPDYASNCIFWGDTSGFGGELNIPSDSGFDPNAFGGGSLIRPGYSDIDGGYTGAGNISANPLFVDPADGDYQIEPDSPGVDAGDNSAVPAGITTDLAGNNRFQDVPTGAHSGSGTAPIVDMGAYEATASLAASAGGPYEVVQGQNVSLQAYGSSGVAGALQYAWDFKGNGQFTDASGATPAFSAAKVAAGESVTVEVGVTDSTGASAVSTATINVVQPVVYVDSVATGVDDGTSWANAFTTLSAALAGALSGGTIEVAAGTYTPTTGTDPRATFQLVDGVSIQGGYAGLGAPNPDARDVTANPTILSGVLAGGVNCLHVVTGSGTDATAALDGFTITGGDADELTGESINTSMPSDEGGGGLLNDAGDPTVSDCIFSDDSADYGGAVFNNNLAGGFTNCIFKNNTATNGGGAMYNSYTSPNLTNDIFEANSTGGNGGAICNYGSPTMVNCVFLNNSASDGGGFYNNFASPSFTNCTFTMNSASGDGSGFYESNELSATFTNCVLWGDSTNASGGEIFDLHIFDGVGFGTPDQDDIFRYSDIEGGESGKGDISADPMFTNAAAGDLTLQRGSPCIDKGNNSALPAGVATDLAGLPRIFNSVVDMGAYEFTGGMEFSHEPASAVAGEKLGKIVVHMENAKGQVRTNNNSRVTLSIQTGPAGGVLGGTTTVMAHDGVAKFSDVQIDVAGEYRLLVTGNLPSARSPRLTVGPGPAVGLVIGHLQGVFDSYSFSETVTLEDAFGNVATGSDAIVNLILRSGPEGVDLRGATQTAAVAGIAMFSDLSLHQVGEYTLVATSNGVGKSKRLTFMFDPFL